MIRPIPYPAIVFVLTALVYVVGLNVTIMELDAAVYAEVSMEMYQSNDYLTITRKGQDWLDKPHFPFWLTAISYEIFGVHTWSYKLPGVVFVAIGAIYTYLFAKKFYGKRCAVLSSIILLTAQHIITSNNDVRAEPFLTGLVIFSLYYAVRYVDTKRILFLIPLSAGLACLIMTKGLFTIIPVAAGVGFSLIARREWKKIFDWRWLICIALTALFMSPALIAYYRQFDMHPEKVVFGRTAVSGVRFFLWDSQWGRFTSTGPITGKGDPFYFVHTMLWAFAPWAIIAVYALYRKTVEVIRGSTQETYTYFGFITLFIIFSLSRFQLSFYLNPLFPLLAIICANELLKMSDRPKVQRTFSIIQPVLCGLLVAGLMVLHYFFDGSMVHIDTVIILLLSLALCIMALPGSWLHRIVYMSALAILGINYYLNREFYPALLAYQSESVMARYVKEENIPVDSLHYVNDEVYVADVMLEQVIPSQTPQEILNKRGYVFTNEAGLKAMTEKGIRFVIVKEFADFPVTTLSGKFINRRSRREALGRKYLLRMEPGKEE